MCGIFGAYNWGDAETLARATQIQIHRGPDDGGVWNQSLPNGGWVALGSRRLAILDLSVAGHMPMPNDSGSLWITYNGEIYNYRELRSELENRGHTFRSNTDTEVILHLYEAEGPDCVARLNGMFAFAIWDSREQQLFLARDPFGVKPLYYTHRGERFAFASEVKGLLQLPGMCRGVDTEALHQYMTFLWVPDPKTMFKGVEKVPAGSYAIYKEGRLRIVQYWDLTFPPQNYRYNYVLPEIVEGIRKLFTQAVKSQMISDVPIGAFLSSGLDSSSIVSIMAKHSGAPVNTFTIAFPQKYRRGEVTLDDTSIAKRVSQRFGCRHHEIIVEPDVVDLLPKILWHLDEPIADPAAITAYLVCKEAKSTATVLLSGVGGDELFAGYRKHIGHYLALRYQCLPASLRKRIIEPLVRCLPSMRGTSLKGYMRLAKKMVDSGSLNPHDRFLMDSTYLKHDQKFALYSKELAAAVDGLNPWIFHRQYFNRVSEADFLNQMLYLDTKAFMISLNLTYNDKMSMASSVEVRVPFLDKQLAEFAAWQVPPSLKIKGVTTKYIFRKAMEGIVPPEVLRAPKAGFGAPVDYWLANELKPMVDDLLSEERVRRRGYFNPEFINKMILEQRRGRQDWSLQIWQLLTFELWLQTFID